MSEIILNCPQCERALRVTQELIGRLVKCPACGLTFTVPAAGNEPFAVPPLPAAPSPVQLRQEDYEPAGDFDAPRPHDDRPGDRQFDGADRERYSSLVTPPAICLLITGLLGLLANSVRAIVVLVSEPQRPGPDAPEFFRMAMEIMTPQVVLISSALFAGLSLLVALGGLQMLRRRMYWLAITGSILAMINLECFCCLLGLPFGIWSLVVLSKPGMRSVFQ